MTATTQSPTEHLDELRSRVRWSPSWGFLYTRCPYCDSSDVVYQMRLCGHTHRPWAQCDACRAHVGWSHDTDLAIRTQLRDLGVPIERRAA